MLVLPFLAFACWCDSRQDWLFIIPFKKIKTMKLTMKTLVGTLLIAALFFSACTKNSEELLAPASDSKTIADEVPTEQNFEQWLAQLEPSEKTISVSHASLEEVNAAMLANGLNPFTAVEVATVAGYRMNAPCSYFDTFGDWNGDSQINILDAVGAQQFLCNSVGCTGDFDTTNEPFNNVKTFGYLSYLVDGTGLLTLNRQDIQRLVEYILGEPVCF